MPNETRTRDELERTSPAPRPAELMEGPGFGLLGFGILGVVLGGLIGFYIGAALGNWLDPPDPIEHNWGLNGIEYVVWGGIIGLLVGAIGLPALYLWVRRRRARREETRGASVGGHATD